MSRHSKHPKYTYTKDNIYYFSRSIPADLRCFYSKPRIIQSLKTNSTLRAKTASKVYAAKLDDYWLGLRLKRLDVPCNPPTNPKRLFVENSSKIKQRSFLCVNPDIAIVR